jgi:hypothetical protein
MKLDRTNTERGAALVTALILLLVLTIIGVAAVTLSSQERINAGGPTKVAFAEACANAAQAKIWAEMSQFGFSYLGSTVQVSAMALSDGNKLIAPAHYGFDGGTLQVKDVVLKAQSGGSDPAQERDCTNGACGIMPLGQTYGVTALCRDASGREFEVELAVKFAL